MSRAATSNGETADKAETAEQGVVAQRSSQQWIDQRTFILDAGSDMRALGWALGTDGFVAARRIAWCEFRNQEFSKDVDALQLVRARLEAAGASDALPLLTSAAIARYALTCVQIGGYHVEVCATVGLGNVECVGERRYATDAARSSKETPNNEDPSPDKPRFASEARVARIEGLGTINIACFIYSPLSLAAQCEALSIVIEARTRAVLEERIQIDGTAGLATGTGTDCVVVCALEPKSGEPFAEFAGKHTALGHALGAASYRAMRRAIDNTLGSAPRAESGPARAVP